MSKGIDVSEAQGVIDFNAIDVDFMLIRVGYGSDFESQDDKQFLRNVQGCTQRGIPYGIYLYSYALNMDECQSEIQHMIRMYNLIPDKSMLKLGLWYDMEDADHYKDKNKVWWTGNGELWSRMCNTWVDAIKNAIGGAVGVYASLSPLRTFLGGIRSDIPKWVACWINGEPDVSEKIFPNAYYWQYYNKGRVNGIRNDVDMNISYVDTPAPAPVPTPDINPQIDVEYCVKTAESGWLPFVKNLEDYAGLYGQRIIDFAVRVSQGGVEYRAHELGTKWFGKISQCNLDDFNNGYAGNNSPIDCVKVYFYTPSDYAKKFDYKRAKYRVHVLGGEWLDWQYDTEMTPTQDGYAGLYGKAIDGLQIVIE